MIQSIKYLTLPKLKYLYLFGNYIRDYNEHELNNINNEQISSETANNQILEKP